MSPILKWALIAFGIGMAIVIWDIKLARAKKGGMDSADKQRIWGIFWLTCFASAGVAAFVWISADL